MFLGILNGQTGPLNGTSSITFVGSDRISLVNDGSPDDAAIRAFNTLTGLDVAPEVPVFWENIGSRITFTASGGASPAEIIMQAYPTYDVYINGRYIGSRGQALQPLEQFVTNPYPFGTVPCIGNYGITPGGRCGDAHSAPDLTARQPDYVKIQ